MTLSDLVLLTRRHYTAIAVLSLVGLLLAGLFTISRAPQYTATASGYVQAGSGSSTGEAYSAQVLAEKKAAAYEDLFTSTPVAQRVVKALGLSVSAPQLRRRVSVRVPPNSVTMQVSVWANTPKDAQKLADTILQTTAAYAAELEVPTGVRGADQSSDPAVRILPMASASLPGRPSYPNPSRILPIGLLLGLLAGYLWAFLRELQDTRVRRTEDLEQITGHSVLGLLPEQTEMSNRRDMASTEDFHTRESLRKLRTNLRFVDIDHTPRSIVITSPNICEGKSTVAGNLARVLAESGERVVLIDADLRRPVTASMFDMDGSIGLTQVLAGAISIDDALQPGDQPGLVILPAGQVPPNPSELLGSQRMMQVIEELTKTYFVILDAPPLLPVTDAALLARNSDGVLLVVRFGSTRKEQVERAVTNLTSVGGRLLGSVMNRTSTKRADRIKYGDAEYGYAQSGYSQGYYRYEPSDPASRSGRKVRSVSGGRP